MSGVLKKLLVSAGIRLATVAPQMCVKLMQYPGSSDAEDNRPCLNAQPITPEVLLEHQHDLMWRGSSQKEVPTIERPGLITRASIESRYHLVEHKMGMTRGTSFTEFSFLARRFAWFVPNGCIHIVHEGLIPKEHRLSLAEEGIVGDDNTLLEAEVIATVCLPSECYVGFVPTTFMLASGALNLNPDFVDPYVVQQNAALQMHFSEAIYEPFSQEIGPILRDIVYGGVEALTDIQQKTCDDYLKNRLKFRLEYDKVLKKNQYESDCTEFLLENRTLHHLKSSSEVNTVPSGMRLPVEQATQASRLHP